MIPNFGTYSAQATQVSFLARLGLGGDLLAARVHPCRAGCRGARHALPPCLLVAGLAALVACREEVAAPGAPPLIYERCRVRAEPGIVLVVRWETVREGRVPIETHAELACLLRAAYPHFPNFFAGTRSWSYVRPELRVICWADESAIATAGALRRFIEVGGKDHLLAIVGLVAVHPERQRARLGVALMEAVADALDDLDVPFGLLTCAPWHVSFYQRAGWHLLSPRRVCYSPDDTADPRPFVDEIATTAMVLPVRSALTEWPDGAMNWHSASV